MEPEPPLMPETGGSTLSLVLGIGMAMAGVASLAAGWLVGRPKD